MTQTAPDLTDFGKPSFASVLADQTQDMNFAGGMRKPPASDKYPAVNHDQLADDIATISYEQALRTHARATPAWNQQLAGIFESTDNATDQAATSGKTGYSALRIHELSLKNRRNQRRSASITIRLSRSECDQIHTRADQAGLTASAYLRSCVLETEDLRAQVKKMIAELKSAQPVPTGKQSVTQSQLTQSRWQMFWRRFFRSRRVAAA